LWDDIGPTTKTYDHLVVIGRTKYMTQLPLTRDNNYRFKDHLFIQALGVNTQDALKQLAGPFYRAIGTVTSVEKSIKKMDYPRITDYKHTKSWHEAKEFVWNMWDTLFHEETRFMQLDEILPNLNLASSPGQPWLACGCRLKSDCLIAPEFYDYYASDPLKRMPPVWKVAPKTQIEDRTNIDNDKIRTFIIPPFEFLLLQKHLYETQNSAMKQKFWSAYGFNPYQGGTSRYAKILLKHKLFVFYDVRGWDRRLPIMKNVYELRNAYIDDRHYALAQWVAQHTIESVLLHCDGTLIKKILGNNSGSGCTTNDNIIAHCFILAYTLLNLYDGDVALVLAIIAFLYGDDNAMSLVDKGFTTQHIEDVFRDSYFDFGLELDPFVVQDTLEGVEFLGFKFHFLEGEWVPQYNIGRLMAAYVYTIDKRCDDGVSLSRAWMLNLMSAGSGREVYADVSRATQSYMTFLKDSTCPVVQSYREIGVPSFEQCMDFYLGRESTIDFESYFDYSILEEVG
jgi:hypothetical protein